MVSLSPARLVRKGESVMQAAVKAEPRLPSPGIALPIMGIFSMFAAVVIAFGLLLRTHTQDGPRTCLFDGTVVVTGLTDGEIDRFPPFDWLFTHRRAVQITLMRVGEYQ